MKKNLKLRAVVSPTPAIIAAAYDENGKADACTLAFYAPTSHKPPCLTIAINATAKRKTLKSILHSGAFTIGYPSVEQIAEADWIGMASGYEHDKIAEVGWSVTKAEMIDAPVINELKLTIECKVVKTVTIGSHTQITGEVVNIQADDSILDERGRYSLEKLKPIIYDEENWRYLAVGDGAARAFNSGLVFKKEG
ncbi:MAG: flavin reductase family protein [Kiritimatiellae bacterium]|nr:flavin reductase family protein [Kiritimatiellia bacterium]